MNNFQDADFLSGLLQDGGALATLLDGYRPRSGQIEMLRLMVDSFNTGTHAVIEAGTGIGKSFAYLIPALDRFSSSAPDNEDRIVISTATIALQHQLIENDIPMVLKAMNLDVKVSLVKGRRNYLCLRRLESSYEEQGLFGGSELKDVKAWSENTVNGERSDLPVPVGNDVWNRICCEQDFCPGPVCPHFLKCFLMISRRRAAESSLLVVNHHLLLSDLSLREEDDNLDEVAVLPPYKDIIFDEAHFLEKTGTDVFGETLNITYLTRILNRIHYKGKKQDRSFGILQKLAEYGGIEAEAITRDVQPLIESVRKRGTDLNILGLNLVAKKSPLRLSGEISSAEQTFLLEPMEKLRESLDELIKKLINLIGMISDEDTSGELPALKVELEQAVKMVVSFMDVCGSFLNREEENEFVFWMERFLRFDGQVFLFCHKTPLSMADVFRRKIWMGKRTAQAVSATLTVDGSFKYWKSRVGADELGLDILEGVFPSPFDFPNRVFLGMPTDGAPPNIQHNYEEHLIQAISKAVKLTGGGALILFTSYQTLERTLKGVKIRLGSQAPRIMYQGEDERSRLLRNFREDKESILFATDSFWVGVDIPGDALRLLIITRLPFRPPNDPVTEARCEVLTRQGIESFRAITLPEAVIRFRQGFGRLMRRSSDYGTILILDSRITSKQYGSLFLQAVPSTVRSIGPLEKVLVEMHDFSDRMKE